MPWSILSKSDLWPTNPRRIALVLFGNVTIGDGKQTGFAFEKLLQTVTYLSKGQRLLEFRCATTVKFNFGQTMRQTI